MAIKAAHIQIVPDRSYPQSDNPKIVRLRVGAKGRGRILAERFERGNRGDEGRDEWLAAQCRRLGVLAVGEGCYFFDRWGGLHAQCDGDDPDAGAFGPSGISRPASPAEIGLALKDGETPWAAADRLGLIEADEATEFDLIAI